MDWEQFITFIQSGWSEWHWSHSPSDIIQSQSSSILHKFNRTPIRIAVLTVLCLNWFNNVITDFHLNGTTKCTICLCVTKNRFLQIYYNKMIWIQLSQTATIFNLFASQFHHYFTIQMTHFFSLLLSLSVFISKFAYFLNRMNSNVCDQFASLRSCLSDGPVFVSDAAWKPNEYIYGENGIFVYQMDLINVNYK